MPPSMRHVDHLMRQGIRERIFPGGVLRVDRGDQTLFDESYGTANLFSRLPMSPGVFFDLASLTKPLATVLAVMALIGRGRLHLEQACGDLCPRLAGSDKATITVRQLLNHSSGLAPWRPFFMELRQLAFSRRKRALRERLAGEPLMRPPGSRSEYSDLGYMLLEWIVEEASGMTLDAFVAGTVYGPLGIAGLFFNPQGQVAGGTEAYAATQLCPWRSRLLVGSVDDDNAFVMGGVGGHAGLFGTARAVASLLHALLAADQDGEAGGCFDPPLVKTFLHAGRNERWALGFDTPSLHGSSAGRYFPGDSVGHLGFTGTSFWVHRQKRIVVILLTNRVHPWRFNPGIRNFRPRLHDAIMEAL